MKCPIVLGSLVLCMGCGPDSSSGRDEVGADVTFVDVAEDQGTAPVNDVSTESAPDAVSEIRLYPAGEPGPFGVGFRHISAAYDEPLTAERRVIPVSVWYPTSDEEGEEARYQDLFRRDQVFADASLAETSRPLPVLAFSHGNGSLPEQSFFMSEHWASHGWVVIAPEHIGNSVFDGLDDEPHAFYRRPLDMAAALDALYGLATGDPLAGRLSEEVVASGHSFGGYTTLAVSGVAFSTASIDCDAPSGLLSRHYCTLADAALDALLDAGFADPRVDVAIPQTPAGALVFAGAPGEDGLSEASVPTLLMTAGRDQALPDQVEGTPIWESMVAGGSMRFHLADAGHFTFSNMCEILPALATDDGCGEEFLGYEVALPLINEYALCFARWVLWEDEPSRAFLFDATPPDPVTLSVR